MIIEYDVVIARSRTELVEEVNERIKAQWSPQGGICVAVVPRFQPSLGGETHDVAGFLSKDGNFRADVYTDMFLYQALVREVSTGP